MEDDDLVIWKREDLETLRRSNLHVINLDLNEDSLIDQVESAEKVDEDKHALLSKIADKHRKSEEVDLLKHSDNSIKFDRETCEISFGNIDNKWFRVNQQP